MPDPAEEARAFNDKWGPPRPGLSPLAEQTERREQELLDRLVREGETPDLLAQLATFCAGSNRKEEAREFLKRVENLAPGSQYLARLYLHTGNAYENLNEFGEAIDYYGRAVEQKSDHEEIAYFAHNNLAYCLNLFRRFSEAEKFCRIAIWINPQRHNAHKNLGIALQGMDRPVEAARAFLMASRLFPLDHRAARHFFALLKEHPEVDEAIPDWKVYVEGYETNDADVQSRDRKEGRADSDRN